MMSSKCHRNHNLAESSDEEDADYEPPQPNRTLNQKIGSTRSTFYKTCDGDIDGVGIEVSKAISDKRERPVQPSVSDNVESNAPASASLLLPSQRPLKRPRLSASNTRVEQKSNSVGFCPLKSSPLTFYFLFFLVN